MFIYFSVLFVRVSIYYFPRWFIFYYYCMETRLGLQNGVCEHFCWLELTAYTFSELLIS